MKKRLFRILTIVLLIACIFPLPATAAGGYFVIRGERVYHSVFCDKVIGYNVEELQWYESLDKLKWTGYEPCEDCADSGFDYEPDGSTYWFSKDKKIQNMLDLERFMGVLDGYDTGNNEGYEDGYSKGYEEGLASAENTILKEAEAVHSEASSYMFITILMIFVLILLCFIVSFSIDVKEKKFEKSKTDAENEITEWKRDALNLVSEEKKSSLAYINSQKEKLQKDIILFQRTVKEEKQSHPMLAAEIADAQHYLDMGVYRQLINKPRPALRAAAELKQIAAEKRELLYKNKQLQYQLDFYEKLFPWLEEFKELPSDEAVSYATGAYGSEYDAVKKWLSPEEYEKLDNAAKYQLALDRWKNRKKEDWDVGIEYERYIGYKLECDGYKVSYLGAMLGLKDMGRDLLATKNGKTLVIQCKRWAKEKTIHEKHIFQLYGSTAVLSTEHPGTQYKAVFITTATLSETARKCAEYCNIAVVENCPIGDYPLIKCNANKDGDKIYHLPFDQQYDKVIVSKNKQSCYAWTTKEAEEKGFRRAYRWHPNKT